MKNNITPEEKLLRILEGPPIEKRRSKFPAKAKSGRLKGLTAQLKNFRISKDTIKKLDLRSTNKALGLLCIGLTIFCVLDLVKSNSTFTHRLINIQKAAIIPPADQSQTMLASIDIKETLAQARNRSIFKYIPPKAGFIPTTNTSDMIKNLKLVGILWDAIPQAMIEDTQDTKTHFLSEGQMFGDLTIKKIHPDRVIIGRDELEWEIR